MSLHLPVCAGASLILLPTCPRCGATMEDFCRDDAAYDAQFGFRYAMTQGNYMEAIGWASK